MTAAEPEESLSEREAYYDNPAKNYVREEWVRAASARRGKSGRTFINYFTLPGVGCLDVIKFRDAGVLALEGEVFSPESLTFCESSSRDYALIRGKLPNAKDVNLVFEDLVQAGQPVYHPWISQKHLFPYDVINLDFTRPPFRLRGRGQSRQIQAITKVFQLQSAHRRSFTLFLTFPAEEDLDDAQGTARLRETIKSNLADGPESFRERYEAIFGRAMPPRYDETYLLAIPKLVLRAGFQEGFEVCCTRRFTYVGRQTRMVSFVFECENRRGTVYQGFDLPVLGNKYSEELVKLLENQPVDVNSMLAAGEGTPSPSP